MMEVWRGEPPQKLGECSLTDPGDAYQHIQFDRPGDLGIDGKAPDVRETLEIWYVGFIHRPGETEYKRVIRLPENFDATLLPGFVPS